METFARIIVGYHGCRASFARDLLVGKISPHDWAPSQNEYDWLGTGIYFWEHSPGRALRWARERYGKSAAVVGAVIQLGACFDLLDEEHTRLLALAFENYRSMSSLRNVPLQKNRGVDWKLRALDCAVINSCLDELESRNIGFDTVRGGFLEGPPIFEGTTISAETHIQVAVRNHACILGVFRPNLK